MMNFANITSADKTSTINLLDFKKFPSVRELHENNIKKVINKLPSSLKTKALTLLLSKGVLSLGYGAVNLIKSTQPVYTVSIWEGHTIRSIMVDLSKVVEQSYMHEVLNKLNIIKNQQEVINIQSSMLTATSTLQIDMAKETIHKTLTDIIENINYYSLVDLYYYAYVKYLTKVSIQQSKQKIFGNVNTILGGGLRKIIEKYSNKDLTNVDKTLVSLALDYLMITQFSDSPAQTTLNNIKTYTKKTYLTKMSNTDVDPEYPDQTMGEYLVSKLDKMQLTKYNRIEEITYVLASIKIINMTPNALVKLISQEFGPRYMEFNEYFDSLVAYLCSGQYKTEIFSFKNAIHYKDELKTLEELVSNAKGQLTYKPL